MKQGDLVRVTDRNHFRFDQVGVVIAAPDQQVFFVEFTTLGNLFYCSEWIEAHRLTYEKRITHEHPETL